MYYLIRLQVENEQLGVVHFYYSLREHQAFYEEIKLMFIYIGAGVFVLSFFLSYFYFNSVAGSIFSFNTEVGHIREGQFETHVMKRKDEIRELGAGIAAMSARWVDNDSVIGTRMLVVRIGLQQMVKSNWFRK